MTGTDAFSHIERFAALVEGAASTVPLDRAALAMAAVLRPGTDEDGAMERLRLLAERCPAASFAALRAHLYDESGFGRTPLRGDDPRHSFLDRVLVRRNGLPILLAVVMIEVGRRLGVPVLGVNLPFHFMVRDARRPDSFMDPATGELLDVNGVRARFEMLTMGRSPWTARHLAPIPARMIIVRMLNNLQGLYERRADPVQLALVARLRATIPELATERSRADELGAIFN